MVPLEKFAIICCLDIIEKVMSSPHLLGQNLLKPFGRRTMLESSYLENAYQKH